MNTIRVSVAAGAALAVWLAGGVLAAAGPAGKKPPAGDGAAQPAIAPTAGPVKVEIRRSDNGEFRLYRGGRPYHIKGAVNDVARMIHQVDPNHPALTVIGDGGLIGGDIREIRARCPDLDLPGVNSLRSGTCHPRWNLLKSFFRGSFAQEQL
ncbi:MAG: hypothetical protein ABSF26_08170 [Thermoguttaceae bacterium]|jgi:hypothetical protein